MSPSPPFHLFQLSQSGANLDNRVPTPASAASADLHPQHVGADLPIQEVKVEAHHDQQEFEATGGKTEPKMEVGLSYVFNDKLRLRLFLWIHAPCKLFVDCH